MVLLRYAALGFRRSALVRPAVIISPPAETLLAGRHSLLQQHHQSFRLSSSDSSPSDAPSVSSPSSPSSSATSTPNTPSNFVPRASGPPPYDIPVLEPPWQISNLSLEEQKAYEKHGANYLDHVHPKRRELAFRAAARRQSIAKLYSKDIGPDWYEICEEAAKKRAQANTREETTLALQKLRDLDLALKKRDEEIWADLALTHEERTAKRQAILRQRKDIVDMRRKLEHDKKLAERKFIGEVLIARGRTPPKWCFSFDDVPEENKEQ